MKKYVNPNVNVVKQPVEPVKSSTITIVIPTVDKLLGDALSIISHELTHYKIKVSKGLVLDQRESRSVQGYMETLVKLSREAREAQKQHDLSSLTDEEISKLAEEIVQSKVMPNKLKPKHKDEVEDQNFKPVETEEQ